MAKRLSERQKEEILGKFREGFSIDILAKDFNCTKLTISRNLKKYLGENEFQILSNNNSVNKEFLIKDQEEIPKDNFDNNSYQGFFATKTGDNEDSDLSLDHIKDDDIFNFTEIIPLNEEIENLPQKDLSSVSISEIKFPKIVYMIVDKTIELEIKHLRDFPEWDFLSENELERKTIKIYTDLKAAKRSCNKEQKVIKVPNPKVFEIAAQILLSRGISRIISDDTLIAL